MNNSCSVELLDLLPGGHAPDAHGLIGTRSEHVAVGGEGETSDTLLLPGELP
ncbi:MAG TPA: hypothetical protein VG099_33010 [Gemmataceae bacterium]|nr:hypothetical protein [Gemmataceae bacterium]